MKFGQKLREQSIDVFDEQWMAHVCDYTGLKKAIGRLRRAQPQACGGEDIEAGVAAWFARFSDELRRFDPFYRGRVDAAQAMVEAVEAALCAPRGGVAAPPPLPPQRKASAAQAEQLKELYLHLQELKFFGELNRTACRKILKKFDKNQPARGAQERFRAEIDALSVSTDGWRVTELSERVQVVYASMHCQGKTRVAQMELDYHVQCMSDIFAYMLSHGGLGNAAKPGDAARAAADESMSPLTLPTKVPAAGAAGAARHSPPGAGSPGSDEGYAADGSNERYTANDDQMSGVSDGEGPPPFAADIDEQPSPPPPEEGDPAEPPPLSLGDAAAVAYVTALLPRDPADDELCRT